MRHAQLYSKHMDYTSDPQKKIKWNFKNYCKNLTEKKGKMY